MNLDGCDAAVKCADYEVSIEPRKGAVCDDPVACDLEMILSVWSWSRYRGIPSVANFSLPLTEGCCECVPEPWANEIVYRRAGVEVWRGPITDVVENKVDGVLSFLAADKSIWAYQEHSVIPEAVTDITETPEQRFARLWGMVDNGSGLELVQVGETGLTISEDVEQYADFSTELGKLAEFGVNWTVVGDTLYYGDLSQFEEPEIIDPSVHWESSGAIVSNVGSTAVSQVHIKTDEWSVFYPPNPQPDPCLGLHIRKIEPEFELTREQALEYARQRYDKWQGQGLQIQTSVDSSITEDWPSSICDMIPGGTYTVDTSNDFCLGATAKAELESMQVEGEGLREQSIKPALQPSNSVSVEL